ncbi:MAG: hypothetical protein LBO69_01020 [Ignavibacteria bacterium]|jgi:hypothetical protein|nr:hypothetical protein [Ignavibacteria bacterium]
MLNKYIYTIILVIFVSINLNAQMETHNWYFGDNAGITFMPSGNNAAFLPNGKTNQMEGTATLSDKYGNLLYYTDGEQVWNAEHSILPNSHGLLGWTSSARSAIIIPMPLSDRYYYVFTIDAFERYYEIDSNVYGKYGMRYSIIDKNIADVDIHNKNIPLLDNAVEKMITINHSNKTDVWLVSYNWKDNHFYVHHISKDGISQMPLMFRRPFPAKKLPVDALFNFEYDLNASKLINCDAERNCFEIYDFNPTNGTIEINNPLSIPAYPQGVTDIELQKLYAPYSACFSADGSKFYGSLFRRALVQWDFRNTNPANIIASRTIIADSTTANIENYDFGAIRRGPDNRIYIARDHYNYLGVISEPNNNATLVNFQSKGVFLQSGKSRWGLPIMMNYTSVPCDYSGYAGDDKRICYGNTIVLGGNVSDTNLLSFEWSPRSFLNDPYSLHPICSAIYDITYILTIHNKILDCVDYDTIKISISRPPSILNASDVTTCNGQDVTIGNSNNSDTLSYEWIPNTFLSNPFSKVTTCTPEMSITYILIAYSSNTGCYAYDTISVNVNMLDSFQILGSKFICDGTNTTLTVKDNFAKYYWSTGDTTQSIIVENAGIYSITITDSMGCTATQDIEIKYLAADNLHIVAPATLCKNSSATIYTDSPFAKYHWSTGETTPTITITQSGTYWVVVENENGCQATDTITIEEMEIQYSAPDRMDFGNICKNTNAILQNGISTADGVDTMFLVDGSHFSLSYDESSTLIQFSVIFEPNENGSFYDTIVAIISMPCYAKIIIPISAYTYNTHFAITANDYEVEPGTKLDIPIRIQGNELGTTSFNYSLDITYNWDVLEITDAQNATINSRTKDGLSETVNVSASFPANSSTTTFILNGFTTIGRTTSTLIATSNFTPLLDCYDYTDASNVIQLVGCGIDMRNFILFNPTTLSVSSTSDGIACTIKTEEVGEFVLTLSDVMGKQVYVHTFSKDTDGLIEKGFVMDNLQITSGLYLISLRSPYNFITNKILFIK